MEFYLPGIYSLYKKLAKVIHRQNIPRVGLTSWRRETDHGILTMRYIVITHLIYMYWITCVFETTLNIIVDGTTH